MKTKFIFTLLFSFFLLFSNAQLKKITKKHKTPYFTEIYDVFKNSRSVKNGKYEKYSFSNILLEKGFYKNNLKDSLWVYYNFYSKAIESTGYYKDNQKIGEWTYNDLKGNHLCILNIENDSIVEYQWQKSDELTDIYINNNWVKKKIFSPSISFDSSKKINTPIATYPQLAIDNDIQGKVIIEVIVDVDGSPLEFSIFKSAGKILDDASLKNVKLIKKWIPAVYENMKVKSKVFIPYRFILG